jgi:RNase P/RNase MRP subunit POP5
MLLSSVTDIMFTSHLPAQRNPAQGLRKIVSPEKSYMEITVEYRKDSQSLDLFSFRALMLSALKQMFGNTGMLSMDVDIYSWDSDKLSGIISCDYHNSIAVRGALTLMSSYDGKPIRCDVKRTSTNLLALSMPSGSWTDGMDGV